MEMPSTRHRLRRARRIVRPVLMVLVLPGVIGLTTPAGYRPATAAAPASKPAAAQTRAAEQLPAVPPPTETQREFEKNHPAAPDRFRLLIQQMLGESAGRQPEGLGEVSSLMTYSTRRLRAGEAGEPVQDKQRRTVELLSKLIEEAERQERQQGLCKNCGGKGCSKCRGSRVATASPLNPRSPMQDSQLPGGSGGIAELNRPPRVRPGETWGKMRPEQREKIQQSLGKNFPSRYRQLVEQYYKQLAKEN